MAIHKNLWLRNTKQRLAGVVFYNRAGETVSRELAAEVANPRTTSQMSQRIKLANLVSLYRANKSWMRDSAFEGKSRNWSVYNAFVHYNLGVSNVALTKSEAAAGATVAEAVQVTRGSLPAVSFNVIDNGTAISTDLYLGEEFTDDLGDVTVGSLSQALIANNNGLQNGMQLSLVFNYQITNTKTGVPYVVARYYEFILNTDSQVAITDTDFGTHLMLSNAGRTDAHISFMPDGDSAIWAAAVILSHTVAGKTYVSDAVFALNSTSVYNLYSSDAHATAAAESYGNQSIDFLSTSAGNNGGSNSDVSLGLGIASVAGVQSGGTLRASQVAAAHQIILTGQPDGFINEITYALSNNDEVVVPDGMTTSGNVITVPARTINNASNLLITQVSVEIITEGTGDNTFISIDFYTPEVDGDGSQTE